MLTAAQGGACAIIKVEYYVYIPGLSGNVSAALDVMKNQVKSNVKWKHSFLDFSHILGEG